MTLQEKIEEAKPFIKEIDKIRGGEYWRIVGSGIVTIGKSFTETIDEFNRNFTIYSEGEATFKFARDEAGPTFSFEGPMAHEALLFLDDYIEKRVQDEVARRDFNPHDWSGLDSCSKCEGSPRGYRFCTRNNNKCQRPKGHDGCNSNGCNCTVGARCCNGMVLFIKNE